ncbi:uncharacterized protein LOC117125145 [Anneissia japonica]|uniref:uncharacterized protein LOC117125145 n=1 Tax=Anneissia japonica TaxID=1529436 RepID=UPI0014258FB7|nr:uncharacterized protein LOC117125145 [Anneissia japonica]
MYVALLAESIEISQNNEEAKIIILGDFNDKIGSLITNGDDTTNYNGQGLIDFSNDSDLHIVNCSDKCTGKFTWFQNQHKSILDYGLVSNNVYDNIKEFLIDDHGIFNLGSDHNMITIEMDIQPTHKIQTVKTIDYCWNIKHDQDWIPFQEDLVSRFNNWDPDQLSANEAWDTWKSRVLFSAKNTIGYKNKPNSKPWFDNEIEIAIKKRKDTCLKYM